MFRVEAERVVRQYELFTDDELDELWQMAIAHNDFKRLDELALVRRWRAGKLR